METRKLALNSAVIAVLNLASFVIGFFVFRISGSSAQRIVQGTAAFLAAIALVTGWLILSRNFNGLSPGRDYPRIFLWAFPWAVVIFVPVHFLVTGYLTGFGNISAIAVYQFAMNALALTLAAAILRRMDKSRRAR
jgi:hypothetical protein